MWGSQGWNQWALQPAMFNDVPHEQIDWAELAKQWIQMQQAQPSESVPLVPPPLPPPPPQVVPPVSLPPPPPPPPGHVPLMTEEFSENSIVPALLKTPVPHPVMPEPFHAESPFENEPVPFVSKTTDNSNFWNKSQWEASVPNDVDERLWAPPPVEPTVPVLPGKETFDYGHVHDNPPLTMQSIDYNHMSEFSYNQMYSTPTPAPEAPYDQYWSQVNATPTIAPIFLKKEKSSTNLPAEEETTQIDAAKRKQLPAWIRDGLEKMEQDRLKRLEKERAAKENAEKMAKMDLLKSNLDFKDGSSTATVSTRSKFDSDSEVDENETNEIKRISPMPKRTPSPTEDMRTEEERKEELVLKVRRTLTEILLSVTNSEMMDIAQEMYRKAVSKAPARQLATASSLSSVASGLRGLANYGTESGASSKKEDPRPEKTVNLPLAVANGKVEIVGEFEKNRKENREEKHNSKKKKKYKRSDSSGSSSSSSHRRKRSSRYESSHGHRERRSRSYDDRERRRKRSVSPYKVSSKSDFRSSRSHRYSDDRHDRKYKSEKKYYDHRHSPSPSGHSSRLPRKYRSRSLSSESQSPDKKSKKYRNR
ncbi:Arginine/serine-rich protein PNISR like protein [Argiope bruennichi]|uniref:Arginine/serine-rich protein PNISR like protein n=1 Tax=Argiope bruennichi TaxID=94029 RepID=A0A8T0ELL5_ARGBR|nr:Arginine/serine-rich protein PNISR like protein [Argiope bruennichi]